MKILQSNPGASFKALEMEIMTATQRVLSSGWYILGEEVRAFEEEFAQYIGNQYCLGVANGTDAIELLLRGLNIGDGDLVATVGNTAVATASAIRRTGANVRFVDVNCGDFLMSPDSLDECLSKEPRIKAIIIVHLFGHPANMELLSAIAAQRGIPLIEDCAQAHGAKFDGKKCGSMGLAGAFSFYPTKNLGAMGDGGAVTTNDLALYEQLLALRQYGWKKRFISEVCGVNSRLDELQAAILSVKLRRLDEYNQKRCEIAACYNAALDNVRELLLPQEQSRCQTVYHQYVIRVKNARRDELRAFLAENEIGTAIHYPTCIPQQPAYADIPQIVSLKRTYELNNEILSLPMYPELTRNEIAYVAQKILEFFQ